MSKSVLIINTPANCFECPCFMETGWRCQCRLDIDEDVHDSRPDWCPLVKASTIEAIPIEWIKRYMESVGRIGYVEVMIEDWEKENANK